jgi:2,3-bisphosphoglycerate-dependent phosphoglycerate mutase
MLTAVSSDGQLRFSDGSSRTVPHWGDTTHLILYCARHCEKVRDGSKDPDLTPEGQARAERLGRILSGAKIQRVCTTPYKRTMQTGEAVQRQTGNPPFETYPPDTQAVWLESVLAGGGGKQYFAAGHSNTIPQLLNLLVGKNQFADIPDDEFGMLYIAVTSGLGKSEVIECKY